MLPERRYCEVRAAANRRIVGTAVRYGDTAVLPGGVRERFEAGAFGDVSVADVVLNFGHVRSRPLARTGGDGAGNLLLRDSRQSLDFEATLPATRDADDALELVRTGVLRGASVEFLPVEERVEANVRVHSRSALVGLGLVDTGAYPDSKIEARQRMRGTRITSTVPADTRLDCGCAGSLCNAVTFAPSIFRRLVREVDAGERTVIASFGSYDRTVGSTSAGSLALRLNDDDGLDIEVLNPPDTAAARELVDLIESGEPVTARPYWRSPGVDPDVTDGVARLTPDDTDVRAIIITMTYRMQGWEPVKLERGRQQRAAAWLGFV